MTRGPAEQSTYAQYQHGEEAQAGPGVPERAGAAETRRQPPRSPRPPATSSCSSLPPPAVVLQFLQLLLHQVGLRCGLGELQHTADDDKSELRLQPPPRTAAGLTPDLRPRSPPRTSDVKAV